MASAAVPGMMSLNSVARYLVQSLVRTFANLSMPNRIGAAVNAIRSNMNACAAGSRRSTSGLGIGMGLKTAGSVLLGSPSRTWVLSQRLPWPSPYVYVHNAWMDVRLKRAYDPPAASDGYRVLID